MSDDQVTIALPARSVWFIDMETRDEERAEKERRAKAARRNEECHNRAVAAFAAEALAQGEPLSALDIASGNVGRTLSEILETARTADPDPQRKPGEHYEVLPVPRVPALAVGEVYEPPHPAARSETGRELANRHRRWRDRLTARRKADDLGPVYLP